MERRDLVLQLLKDAAGPIGEDKLLEQMHLLHGIWLTKQSVRMLLRDNRWASCVKEGPLGAAVWEHSPDGRAR
jgi:hypothetical protein